MKKRIILLSLVGAVFIFGGCQDSTIVDSDNLQKTVDKKITETDSKLQQIEKEFKKVSNHKNVDDKKTIINNNKLKKDLTTNKKNTMNGSSTEKTEDNTLPIDMDLAISCKTVTLKTNMGDVQIEMFGKEAPVTVANFCTLSKKGFYDGLIFHRIIQDFMIQGGDPQGSGMGGPGYKFEDEIYAGNRNDEYTIAMANSGPDTNGSQFFINTKANNFLDTKHTVFGKVIKGQDVVDKIEAVKTGIADKPVEDVVIKKAVIGK